MVFDAYLSLNLFWIFTDLNSYLYAKVILYLKYKTVRDNKSDSYFISTFLKKFHIFDTSEFIFMVVIRVLLEF